VDPTLNFIASPFSALQRIVYDDTELKRTLSRFAHWRLGCRARAESPVF